MNIEIPPAQDSPKHILIVLNDDCVQSIFRRLDNVCDFLSAAETCVRFQENAKLVFRTQYKSIHIGKSEWHSDTLNIVTLNRLQSLLCIFGPLIVKIVVNTKINSNILNMIADYCGKTLTSIELSSSNVINLNTRSPFKALKELELDDTNIKYFKCKSELQRLIISGEKVINCKWLIQSFPHLETVELSCIKLLRIDQVDKFLKLNPQLRSLCIELCEEITPIICESIVNHVPKLEKLFFNFVYSTQTIDLNRHLLNLSKLRNLRFLGIYSEAEISGKLIDSLIENNVPVEVLGFFIRDMNISTSKLNIPQMKHLKRLFITQMSDDTLVKYIKHLPKLEEIICLTQNNGNASPKITVAGIKGALKYGKSLSNLSVNAINLIIDLDDFKSILNLARGNIRRANEQFFRFVIEPLYNISKISLYNILKNHISICCLD